MTTTKLKTVQSCQKVPPTNTPCHIGDWYKGVSHEAPVAAFHKLLHGLNGGFGMYIEHGTTQAFVTGFTGAALTETILETRDNYFKAKAKEYEQQALQEGRPLDEKEAKAIEDKVVKDFEAELIKAQLSTAVVAVLLGQDAHIAVRAGTVAAEHNSLEGVKATVREMIAESQREYVQALDAYLDGVLINATKATGRPLTPAERAEVCENATELFTRAYSSAQASKALLSTATYVPGTGGAVAGLVDAAYGYGTGQYDALEAGQAMVTASMGVAGKGLRTLHGASKVAQRLDKAQGHGTGHTDVTVQNPKPVRKAQDDFHVGQFKGGAHGKLEALPSFERHHMPADSITNVPYRKGPAIQMVDTDHALTSSYGSSAAAKAYRDRVQQLIESGNMRSAMATEIRDVRRVAGAKYNAALQEMLAYSKNSGIVPGKK